jgi:uncharacterized protein (TIGR02145 family)
MKYIFSSVFYLWCLFSYSQINSQIRIGKQVWMLKNLNTDKFRNGDLIPEAKTKEEWVFANENMQPAWCYYDNNPANGKKYGKLYNWYAVNDSRGLAPIGWHIPSDEEWTTLVKNVGDQTGLKMKSQSGWNAFKENGDKMSSGNGTNSSGFLGLPGGFRVMNGIFAKLGDYGSWWSSTEDNQLASRNDAWRRSLLKTHSSMPRTCTSKREGLSVRCVKD